MGIAEDVKGGTYASAPAEIRAAAEEIAKTYGFDEALLAGAICAAILAERERCAKIADAQAKRLRAGGGGIVFNVGGGTADAIARGIRSGAATE